MAAQVISQPARQSIGFVVVALLLVAVAVLPVLWGVWSFLTQAQGASGAGSSDPPTPLATVSVPAQPNSLAWSADGRYLAAGTWGSTTGDAVSYEVYVVEVAKASVLTTLKTTSRVEGLAFSPDGKWLAVANRPSFPATEVPSELVVFDVPAFTVQVTAKVGAPENGFVELAWAPDSKSLLAIDGPVDNAWGKAEIRRWDIPAFSEQPVVRKVQLLADAALALSPDGHTLALSFGEGEVKKSLVQLFDLGSFNADKFNADKFNADKEGEQSLRSGDPFWPPRLGFTADGKAVGVFDTKRMLWWDVATGRPVDPGPARFAVQPAGMSDLRSRAAVSPDGTWQASGFEQHRALGDLGFDNREKEFGGFVKLTKSGTDQTRTWRVSRAQYPPAVAFSPDGTRLAGTVWQPIRPGSRPGSDGGLILIWAVPK